MTDTLAWSAEEFADFWESHESEKELGIAWMASQMATSEGINRLEEAATILGTRHGWSSDPVKGFRSAMRKASEKAGLDPMTVRKDGDKTVGYRMKYVPARRHTSPKVANPEELVYGRMLKWVEKGVCSVDDLSAAVWRLESYVKEVNT